MVLYQLLTGVVPFSDEAHVDLPNASLIYAIVHEQARPIFEPNVIPKSLVALYEECNSADGSRRPPFTEIAARLERTQPLVSG